MFFSSRSLLVIAFSIHAGSLATGCAGRALDRKLASSSDSSVYALRYPEDLELATKRVATEKQRAHELSSALPAHARELKPGSDRALLTRIVDESDRAGRSDVYGNAQRDERAMRAFWDDERGALGSRVSLAAQKELADAGCTQPVELGAPVQHALRDGLDKQLERRLRATNEGQRTVELHKSKLAPGSLPAVQRLSDEVALASQLANVALVEDLRELDRLLHERKDIERTLDRMLDDERTLQSDPHKPAEQKASQDRVVQIEKARSLIPERASAAEAALTDSEQAVRLAQDEYDNTIQAIKASFAEIEPAPPPAAVSVKP